MRNFRKVISIVLALVMVLGLFPQSVFADTDAADAIVREGEESAGETMQPTDPENPGEPADPENPGEPADPENPGEPADPENPGEPADPENPDEPVGEEPTSFHYIFASYEDYVMVLSFVRSAGVDTDGIADVSVA